jgi:hypothetical protein
MFLATQWTARLQRRNIKSAYSSNYAPTSAHNSRLRGNFIIKLNADSLSHAKHTVLGDDKLNLRGGEQRRKYQRQRPHRLCPAVFLSLDVIAVQQLRI